MNSKSPKPNRMSAALYSDPLAATVEAPAPVDPPVSKEPVVALPVPVAQPVEVVAIEAQEEGIEGSEQSVVRGRRITRSSELGDPGYKAGGRRPASDLLDVAPVRMTAYLTPAQVKLLRKEVARRVAKGKRADLSMLIREAIDAKFAPEGR